MHVTRDARNRENWKMENEKSKTRRKKISARKKSAREKKKGVGQNLCPSVCSYTAWVISPVSLG
jgi:hypothetical protein